MALAARAAVFHNVFPSTSDASSITPQATPVLAQESFDQPRGTEAALNTAFPDTASESVGWERAWHGATSFLLEKLQAPASTKACSHELRAALEYLRSPTSVGWRLRRSNKAEDLLWWYSQAMQEQFLKHHSPILRRMSRSLSESATGWSEFRSRLIISRTALVGPFVDFISPCLGGDQAGCSDLLQTSYSALVDQALFGVVNGPLRRFLKVHMSEALETSDASPIPDADSMQGIESSSHDIAVACVQDTLSDLRKGGFSQELLEKVFAGALSSILKAHIESSCARRWTSPSPVVAEVRNWTADSFSAIAGNGLHSIRKPLADAHLAGTVDGMTDADVATWQKTALRELGLLRLSELFDMIVDWENDSRGGIEDLRQYIQSQQTRQHIVNHFNDVLSYRLLHPGASTDQILEIYIKIMRAFAVLDQRFVILDRVSRPIRRYLRDREDTIRIIVSGLLSDPTNPETSSDSLGELAVELHEMDEIGDREEEDGFDWDDMSWAPNPADAEADYKSSKGLDVIGNLLSLFETQDIVVREFQNILGERLLTPENDFSREIRVLELLKSRFGEASLQDCEVMIKDIFDSSRTDLLIKKEQKMDQGDEDQPKFYSKILSRFFWPSLRDDTFHVPEQIHALQERYSDGFEEHKMQRKLAWLPSLGQVQVELQLEDRTVSELVSPWQASVIYSFHDAGDGRDSPEKTRDQLAEELDMDEDLVINALTFWVSKMVLYQSEPGKFQVLENLPSEKAAESASNNQESSANIVAAAHSASAAAAASAASAVRSEQELAEEKMEVLWQYVVGMLTNQGAMPLQQMVMMLNFVVPGGFTHSQDEFRQYLQRKVEDGKLQMAGANFKMPKK